MIRRFFLALILLAGCSTLPMTKLLMRNPLNVDPLVFRFAIATQKDVFTEILEETPVYLQFKYDLDKASEFMQESVKDRAFLQAYPNETAPGVSTKPENTLVILGLKPEDARALKQRQTQVKKHRQAGGTGSGSVSLLIRGDCAAPAQTEGIKASLHIRTDMEEGYFFLSDNVDLSVLKCQP